MQGKAESAKAPKTEKITGQNYAAQFISVRDSRNRKVQCRCIWGREEMYVLVSTRKVKPISEKLSGQLRFQKWRLRMTGDPALVLLGKIVNRADTDNSLWNQPEGSRPRIIAEGVRHLRLKEDRDINPAEWIVYDALYAYCQ